MHIVPFSTLYNYSAFVLLVSTIIPIYFNYLAENAGISAADYLAFWGYAASATTIIVALIGPVFGTLADTQGLKKPIFTIYRASKYRSEIDFVVFYIGYDRI